MHECYHPARSDDGFSQQNGTVQDHIFERFLRKDRYYETYEELDLFKVTN